MGPDSGRWQAGQCCEGEEQAEFAPFNCCISNIPCLTPARQANRPAPCTSALPTLPPWNCAPVGEGVPFTLGSPPGSSWISVGTGSF